ncbi:glycosyltransferase [Nitritalea halalkaliphila]|uniref:glycosyltransferase n=1 Tax=Nitritalea halalkaliphila TaxID=590849 RepID=UPI001EE66756
MSPTLSRLKNEHNVLFDCFIISPISNEDRLAHKRTFNHVISNEYINGPLTKIRKIGILFSFFNLWKISRNLPKYDIVHIHYHHWYIALISKILRRKCSKLIISFFGSDFNEVSKFHHFFNKRSIGLADTICATNPVFLSKIFNFYYLDAKRKASSVLFPLMSSFSEFEDFLKNNDSIMAKNALNLDKKIITCGYNGARIVQHQSIWKSIVESKIKKEEYKVIFPMTYGTGKAESINNLKQSVAGNNFDVSIIEDYLEINDLRRLRLSTDIFIHIQTRDQFSASMLEHLAAGSVSIIGKWLPYDLLREKGVYAVWINSPDELTEALNNVISNFQVHKDRTSVNRRIILDLVDWNNIKKDWVKVYSLN